MFKTVIETVQAGKELLDGVKTLTNLDGEITDKRQLTDLLALASSSYTKVLEVQSLCLELEKEKEALLQENLKLKNWQQEKANYELHALAENAWVYKANMDTDKPSHYLCASCYQNNVKSILQADGFIGFDRKLICHNCSHYVRYRDSRDQITSRKRGIISNGINF